MTRPPRLSPREIECLRALADGDAPKAIAHKLSISVRTCQHYIASGRSKLGAKNATHAVAIALTTGALDRSL